MGRPSIEPDTSHTARHRPRCPACFLSRRPTVWSWRGSFWLGTVSSLGKGEIREMKGTAPLWRVPETNQWPVHFCQIVHSQPTQKWGTHFLAHIYMYSISRETVVGWSSKGRTEEEAAGPSTCYHLFRILKRLVQLVVA